MFSLLLLMLTITSQSCAQIPHFQIAVKLNSESLHDWFEDLKEIWTSEIEVCPADNSVQWANIRLHIPSTCSRSEVPSQHWFLPSGTALTDPERTGHMAARSASAVPRFYTPDNTSTLSAKKMLQDAVANLRNFSLEQTRQSTWLNTHPAVWVSAMWFPPLIFPGVSVISVDPTVAPSRLPLHMSLTSSRPDRCWGLVTLYREGGVGITIEEKTKYMQSEIISFPLKESDWLHLLTGN